MSLNKIKTNQLDFDVSQIALSAGSGSFVSSGLFIASSGVLRNDINNQSGLINNLSVSGFLISGNINSLSGNCVFLTGNQNITGIKNFESIPTYKNSPLVYRSQIDLSNLVYATGNQTISGTKNFASRSMVNNTGVLLSGEASAIPSTITASELDFDLFSNTLQFPTTLTSRNLNFSIGADFFNRLPTQNTLSLRLPYTSPRGDTIRITVEYIPANKVVQISDYDLGPGWRTAFSYSAGATDRFLNDEVLEFQSKGINQAGYSIWSRESGPNWNSTNGIKSISNKPDFTYNTGNQTINGQKTFQHPIIVSGRRNLLEDESFIVYTTGVQNVGGTKNFTGQRPQISGFGILHSGETARISHTHSSNDITDINPLMSGKLNTFAYSSTNVTSSATITVPTARNAIYEYTMSWTGTSTFRLPRQGTGIIDPPINGDQLTLQFLSGVNTVSGNAVIQTGNPGGVFSNFITIRSGIGRVSVFYANNMWKPFIPYVESSLFIY